MSEINDFPVAERIDTAIKMVEEARPVPLSASCVVHRGNLMATLDQARAALPIDLAAAQEVLRNRDQIIEDARTSAETMMLQAREEVALMIEQTEIVASARREAEVILATARAEGERERDEIESYIDSRLANLEVILSKSLDVIAKGRERLAGNTSTAALTELSELAE